MPRSFSVIRRLSLRHASHCLAVLGVLSASSVFGDDAKSNSRNGDEHKKTSSEKVEVPECLEKLKLSSKQQDEIKGIVRKYDSTFEKVWSEFGDRYMKTITLESSMLAAIEDHFTDEQRKQIRDQRHKTAQHEKAAVGTSSQPNQAKPKSEDIVKEELSTSGVSLTSEQQAMAEQVQDKYRMRLRSMNRDIQGLHIRLLSLESDKLAAIEDVLTKDQLAQLRSEREQAPGSKLSDNKTVQRKSE